MNINFDCDLKKKSLFYFLLQFINIFNFHTTKSTIFSFCQKQIKPSGKEKHYPTRKGSFLSLSRKTFLTTGMVDSKSLPGNTPICDTLLFLNRHVSFRYYNKSFKPIKLTKAFFSLSHWSQNNANLFAPFEHLKPNNIPGGPKKHTKSNLLPNLAF